MPRPDLRRVLGSRGRRRIAAALALLAAIAVVVVVIAGAGSSSPKTNSGSDASSGATTVERRDLIETDTESGTLSYANPQTVYDRLSGTITWLPGVGRVIKPGATLFKVGGEPVILMDGTTPAYRDLTPADSDGGDILQLNRNLVALGFNPDGIVVDDAWQAATTAAVDAFQASLGETETGSLSLGQVVFLPGPQLISTVDATLGSNGTSSSSGTSASTSAVADRPQFVSLKTGTSTSPGESTTNSATTPQPKTTKPKTTKQPSGGKSGAVEPHSGGKPGGSGSLRELQALIALLRAELAELRAERGSPGGAHSGSPNNGNSGSPSNHGNHGNHGDHGSPSHAGNSGSPSSSPNSSGSPSNSDGASGSGTASEILQTTSTKLVVTVDLDAAKQSEAKVGERVTVEMPAGNQVDGKVTAVSPVAQSSSGSGSGNGSGGGSGNGSGNGSGSGSGATIPVTITLSGHHTGAGLDQAAVSVNFAQARANNVLSVPVTALLATAGGGYAVQEAAAPHKLIPVTAGLFAAGSVQISGAGIYPGLQVTDSQG